MASLGVRTLDELIGRVDLLGADEAIEHWKARGVDLTHLLHRPPSCPRARRAAASSRRRRCSTTRWTGSSSSRRAPGARGAASRVALEPPVRNVNRCVGGILSSRDRRARTAPTGLPEDTIEVDLHRLGRPVFGGWLAPGVTFTLHGDANDYAGKGLSGGVLAVRAARGRRRSSPRRTSSSATPCSTARRAGARSSAAWPASASRCATRAPARSSRASATTAAST